MKLNEKKEVITCTVCYAVLLYVFFMDKTEFFSSFSWHWSLIIRIPLILATIFFGWWVFWFVSAFVNYLFFGNIELDIRDIAAGAFPEKASDAPKSWDGYRVTARDYERYILKQRIMRILFAFLLCVVAIKFNAIFMP